MSVDLQVGEAVVPRWLSVADVERLLIALAAAAAVLLRIAAVFHYRIDSDEPQHLHVVWGWTHGLLQYRDVFDNHMPLFQILCAPLLRIVGERADALIAMRMAMLPLYAATIALTYRIASSCYSRRAAIWATVAASLIPGYLLWSTEFRTDDLWTVFWLIAIAILVGGDLTNARVFAAGLALGFAAAVSAKTTLLLVAVIVGAVAAKQAGLKRAAIFLFAFAIPPAAVAIVFAAIGAWHPFFYGAIAHNAAYGHYRVWRVIVFPLLLLLIGFLARRVGDSPQRIFLFVTTHFYAAALYCLWPLVEHEHWLPYLPLAAVTIVPLLRIRQVMAVVLIEILLVIGFGRLWRDQTRNDLAIIQQTLQLTRPGESVMDLKGETVFRNRAFFYVLEPLTKQRIRAGKLSDTIIADLLRTKTMLVAQDHYGFPHAARKFLRRNFVSIGAVRVAGKILRSPVFPIEVPGEYAVITEGGTFHGVLDGSPYGGPRYLQAGIHSLSPALPAGSWAVLWSRAAEFGLAPFRIPQKHRRKLSPRMHVPPGSGLRTEVRGLRPTHSVLSPLSSVLEKKGELCAKHR